MLAYVCVRMDDGWASRSAGTNGYLLTLPHRAAPTPRSNNLPNPPHMSLSSRKSRLVFFSNLSFLVVVESVLGTRLEEKSLREVTIRNGTNFTAFGNAADTGGELEIRASPSFD